jgi:hypothetical protein
MKFTFENLAEQLRQAISMGYSFLTCEEWANGTNKSTTGKCIVLRVDVDEALDRLPKLLEMFEGLHVKASIFVRLHGPYNIFSFENYRIIRNAISLGHEIGYHSEVVDQAAIWGESQADCLRRDIRVLTEIFDYKIVGVASHGGRTGLNNLDFWRDHSPSEFGLLYEAYDRSESFGLFHKSLYISDSEWTQWKSYWNGIRNEDDRRSLKEHLLENPKLVYLLIHPETFYAEHPYE